MQGRIRAVKFPNRSWVPDENKKMFFHVGMMGISAYGMIMMVSTAAVI
ncbi:hypothetical protein SPACI_014890 [Sporomusa acidovorans DSM 3132]|uniref:Uncharacterized protein n=1 Tax=Sporomusa acidovorans (strain ATCC 49682 / DSM 3132 / Mol) TaxID=1123286 RepID=A0ABZ3IZW8_SPOA4|nr:hypothetical protein [Sporomusa acidovorans]OZC21979.1 hypothetical protein SPACI_16620 [Sporomusa acidovorans DSM 3132]SDF64969.1 hypothetical protein SAMN04488499_106515 [Sporomusa acidovorans]